MWAVSKSHAGAGTLTAVAQDVSHRRPVILSVRIPEGADRIVGRNSLLTNTSVRTLGSKQHVKQYTHTTTLYIQESKYKKDAGREREGNYIPTSRAPTAAE